MSICEPVFDTLDSVHVSIAERALAQLDVSRAENIGDWQPNALQSPVVRVFELR